MIRDDAQPGGPLAVGALVLGGLACALAVLAYDASGTLKLACGLASLYLVASLVLHPRWSVLYDPFSFFAVTRVMVLAGYVFSCLYVATAGDTTRDAQILTALAIGLVTVILTDLGAMFIPRARAAGFDGPATDRSIEIRLFLILFLGGWLWRAYAMSAGLMYGTHLGTRLELTGASNLLGTLNAVGTLGAWGLVVFTRRIRRAWLPALLEVAWMLVSGSKGGLLYILVPLFMILFQRGAIRINLRLALTLALVLAVFLGSFVVVHGYRVAVVKQVAAGGYESVDLVGAVGEIEVTAEDFELVGESLSKRLNLAERFLMILETRDERQDVTWGGESYLTGLLWFVPRSIWSEKPSMSLGRWFGVRYLGFSEDSRSEAGVTVWGEGLLNFGIVGAMLAPALWMLLLQVFYVVCLRIGPWGLVLLGLAYLRMINSLAANVAAPISFLSQSCLMVGFVYVVTVVIRGIMSELESRKRWQRGSV